MCPWDIFAGRIIGSDAILFLLHQISDNPDDRVPIQVETKLCRNLGQQGAVKL